MTMPGRPFRPRSVATLVVTTFAATLLACHHDESQANADAASNTAAESAVFDSYAPLKRDAVKVDVAAFASGDVALAKGRRIAPVLREARVAWAKEEASLGEQNAEVQRLLNRLASPRAPYCPGNAIALCHGHPWFADNPSTAGVIVYVEQRTEPGGVYGPGGANAYDTKLEFDAVLMPEKVRVARWWRLALAPQSQLTMSGTSTSMMIGSQTAESFEADMQSLSAGVAPVGDLSEDPWREKDAGAPVDAGISHQRGRSP